MKEADLNKVNKHLNNLNMKKIMISMTSAQN